MADLLDIAHSYVVDGADVNTRMNMERAFEESGHKIRADADPRYKRATWGMRPKDREGIKQFAAGPKEQQEAAPYAGGGSLKDMRTKARR